MGKKNKKKNKGKTKNRNTNAAVQGSAPTSYSWWKRAWVKALAVLSFAATIVGVAPVYGLYYIVPDITPPEIRAGDPPLYSPFTFSNNNLVALRQVEPSCIIVYVETAGGIRHANSQATMIPAVTGDIAPGEKRTHRCFTQIMGPYEQLRIAVCASYGLWFWPFRRFVDKRFYVSRSADRTPFWVAGTLIGDDPVPIRNCDARTMPRPREGQR